MDFPRRSGSYFVPYTKKQAIEELLKDSRIDKITSNNKCITVLTKPINPKCSGRFKKIYLTSIGTYKIYIINNKKSIKIEIEHTLGGTFVHDWDDAEFHHFHIRDGFTPNGVCWGSVECDINTICEKKDYYYAVKYSLDLLEDGYYDDALEDGDNYSIMLGLQMLYCKEHGKLKTLSKLKKLFDKYVKYDDDD